MWFRVQQGGEDVRKYWMSKKWSKGWGEGAEMIERGTNGVNVEKEEKASEKKWKVWEK